MSAKEIVVKVFGNERIVRRSTLLNHYKLRNLSVKIVSEKDKSESINALFEYLNLALGITNSEEIDIEKIPHLFSDLLILNEKLDYLPWQTVININTKNKRYNTDYENRELTVIVNLIAAAYGWSQEQILSLQPEVAACYIQEILLDDWNYRHFLYALSEVGYDKDGRQKPFVKPEWYIEMIGPRKDEAFGRIPARFMPKGVIKDVSKKT